VILIIVKPEIYVLVTYNDNPSKKHAYSRSS
jgi:hypothetical protein